MNQKTLTCRIVKLGYLNPKLTIYVKYHLKYRSQVLEVFDGADSTKLDKKIEAWATANNFTHINWVGPEWYAGLQKKLGN